MAAYRATKAAAATHEYGQQFEHIATLGSTLRLKRVKPSPVPSFNAPQSVPQIPLPPQVPAPPPQPLPYIAAIIAPLDRLSPHERQNLLAARTQRELKAGQRCISTGGRAKQTLALLPVNASSPPKKKEQEILQLCQELKVPNIGVIEEPPVRPVTMTGQQAFVWMQKCVIKNIIKRLLSYYYFGCPSTK